MRFLTIRELHPRRRPSDWVADWDSRLKINMLTAYSQGRDQAIQLFNEGTLLLHRFKKADLARDFCRSIIEHSSTSSSHIPPEFIAQQWINLIRLDSGQGYIEAAVVRLSELNRNMETKRIQLRSSDSIKLLRICAVEDMWLANLMGKLEKPEYYSGKYGSKSFGDLFEVHAEANIRILRRSKLSPIDSLDFNFYSKKYSRLFLLAVLVLLSESRILKASEAQSLCDLIIDELTNDPVHTIQIAEQIFIQSQNENKIILQPLLPILIQLSRSVGDAQAEEAFQRTMTTSNPLNCQHVAGKFHLTDVQTHQITTGLSFLVTRIRRGW